ncbi:hypothetical protein BHM03_00028601 [Ensete ventricosum]|nr:hypothetical protein BHM03_00028601 [Ensete ventricosum]
MRQRRLRRRARGAEGGFSPASGAVAEDVGQGLKEVALLPFVPIHGPVQRVGLVAATFCSSPPIFTADLGTPEEEEPSRRASSRRLAAMRVSWSVQLPLR